MLQIANICIDIEDRSFVDLRDRDKTFNLLLRRYSRSRTSYLPSSWLLHTVHLQIQHHGPWVRADVFG